MAPKKKKTDKSRKNKNKKEDKSKDKKKVIRDSFTIPENDYALIKTLKQRFLDLGISVKKSELLRAGLHALHNMSDEHIKKTIGSIEIVKTGRPANSRQAEPATTDEDSNQEKRGE
jgi:hypothetical protein